MAVSQTASRVHSSSGIDAAAKIARLDAEIAKKQAAKDALQSKAKISAVRRGRSKLSYPPRKCRYCKGLFIPFQKSQLFCTESHRKLYWKYGTIPFEKLARRLGLRFENEVEPLRARVAELERLVTEARAESSRALYQVGQLEEAARVAREIANDPDAGEPACIDWESIDRANREAETRKSGGGAAA